MIQFCLRGCRHLQVMAAAQAVKAPETRRCACMMLGHSQRAAISQRAIRRRQVQVMRFRRGGLLRTLCTAVLKASNTTTTRRRGGSVFNSCQRTTHAFAVAWGAIRPRQVQVIQFCLRGCRHLQVMAAAQAVKAPETRRCACMMLGHSQRAAISQRAIRRRQVQVMRFRRGGSLQTLCIAVLKVGNTTKTRRRGGSVFTSCQRTKYAFAVAWGAIRLRQVQVIRCHLRGCRHLQNMAAAQDIKAPETRRCACMMLDHSQRAAVLQYAIRPRQVQVMRFRRGGSLQTLCIAVLKVGNMTTTRRRGGSVFSSCQRTTYAFAVAWGAIRPRQVQAIQFCLRGCRHLQVIAAAQAVKAPETRRCACMMLDHSQRAAVLQCAIRPRQVQVMRFRRGGSLQTLCIAVLKVGNMTTTRRRGGSVFSSCQRTTRAFAVASGAIRPRQVQAIQFCLRGCRDFQLMSAAQAVKAPETRRCACMMLDHSQRAAVLQCAIRPQQVQVMRFRRGGSLQALCIAVLKVANTTTTRRRGCSVLSSCQRTTHAFAITWGAIRPRHVQAIQLCLRGCRHLQFMAAAQVVKAPETRRCACMMLDHSQRAAVLQSAIRPRQVQVVRFRRGGLLLQLCVFAGMASIPSKTRRRGGSVFSSCQRTTYAFAVAWGAIRPRQVQVIQFCLRGCPHLQFMAAAQAVQAPETQRCACMMLDHGQRAAVLQCAIRPRQVQAIRFRGRGLLWKPCVVALKASNTIKTWRRGGSMFDS